MRFNPWVCLGFVVACLLSYGAGDWHGHGAEALAGKAVNATADSAVDQAQLQVDQQVADAEKKLGRLLDNREAQHQKENEDAQKKIAALHADIAAGRMQLSIATRKTGTNTGSGTAATGNGEERTELVPATADAFIDVAAESARDVRDRNSCIDSYNDALNTVNGLRATLLSQAARK